MRTIRWGIIGCGDVTEVKSGPGFQKASHSRLVAVMRRNGDLARDYAHRHGVPRWYDSAEDLIGDPDVDAVYIATPPAFHKEYTLLSAQAGKPVYVEKPMALNFQECRQMIQACQAAGVPLFVAYYRRALARFLNIKQLLDTQAIGEPRFVNITLYQPIAQDELTPQTLPWRVIPELAGGGRFVDLASHMLDFLDYPAWPDPRHPGLCLQSSPTLPGRGHGHRYVYVRVGCTRGGNLVLYRLRPLRSHRNCRQRGQANVFDLRRPAGDPDQFQRPNRVRIRLPGAHSAAADPGSCGCAEWCWRLPEHRRKRRPDIVGDG